MAKSVPPTQPFAAAEAVCHTPELVRPILACIGPGHYLPLASVCRHWHDFCNASQRERVTAISAMCATRALLRWAHARGMPWRPYMCEDPVLRGDDELLQWAAEAPAAAVAAPATAEAPPLADAGETRTPRPVAARHRFGGSKGWHKREPRQPSLPGGLETMVSADDESFPEALARAHARDYPLTAATCALAAFHGQLEALQWARRRGCAWDGWTCAQAAMGGHLQLLEWARLQGCSWDEATCSGAAAGGHLEVLKWARLQGCPWDETTCAGAAGGGHLEVLKWARGCDCPWDLSTCTSAAASGHLRIVHWARYNIGPWNWRVVLAAARDDATRAWITANK